MLNIFLAMTLTIATLFGGVKMYAEYAVNKLNVQHEAELAIRTMDDNMTILHAHSLASQQHALANATKAVHLQLELMNIDRS